MSTSAEVAIVPTSDQPRPDVPVGNVITEDVLKNIQQEEQQKVLNALEEKLKGEVMEKLTQELDGMLGNHTQKVHEQLDTALSQQTEMVGNAFQKLESQQQKLILSLHQKLKQFPGAQ